MTIDDQITVYLTGEEMLPSNQKRVIEQAKFTYSPLEKAFEKQIIMEKNKLRLYKTMKKNKYIMLMIIKKLLISKERETFKNIYNKRLDKIEELDKN